MDMTNRHNTMVPGFTFYNYDSYKLLFPKLKKRIFLEVKLDFIRIQ